MVRPLRDLRLKEAQRRGYERLRRAPTTAQGVAALDLSGWRYMLAANGRRAPRLAPPNAGQGRKRPTDRHRWGWKAEAATVGSGGRAATRILARLRRATTATATRRPSIWCGPPARASTAVCARRLWSVVWVQRCVH
eukprot:scaffold1903_cov396-Prasinococcus_capsulatus_cf.AAC.5